MLLLPWNIGQSVGNAIERQRYRHLHSNDSNNNSSNKHIASAQNNLNFSASS